MPNTKFSTTERVRFALLGCTALVASVITQAETTTYTYDALGRLTAAAITGGQTQSYTYDAADNRTEKSVSSAPANNAPVAVNDSATATSCIGVNHNVVANDSDPDGDPLTITGVTGSPYAIYSGHTINIEPAPTFQGTITVTYTISDGRGGTASATLTGNFPNGWCSGGGLLSVSPDPVVEPEAEPSTDVPVETEADEPPEPSSAPAPEPSSAPAPEPSA